jgi:hypothetical protein
MTTLPTPDLAAQWSVARKLYPMYFELSREFVIDVQPCADLEAGIDTPGQESVEQAARWLDELDQRIQVHQLRQYLQTSTLVDQQSLLDLLQRFLAKPTKDAVVRDKVDFLLVQYFSQVVPSGLEDQDVDLVYVAQTLDSLLGQIELKAPLWLNALDRVLDSIRKCKTLDELLHGGVLEQGRKVKNQAGDLFFMPVALVAFTRFGYLMRRAFFRLMHGDLNAILDGLTELEEKNIATIDCRRAQFSAEEPVARLRIICQSWKVMFQAEYSSGQPLRMLVDLRASVEHALGRGKSAAAPAAAPKVVPAKVAASGVAAKAAPAAPVAKAAAAGAGAVVPKPAAKPVAKAAVAAKSPAVAAKPAAVAKPGSVAKSAPAAAEAGFAPATGDTPEFEISVDSTWDEDTTKK